MLKNPAEYERDNTSAKFVAISRHVSSFLARASAGYCQRAPDDKSGMITAQTGRHKDKKTVAVHGTHCATPPRNSNSTNQFQTAASSLKTCSYSAVQEIPHLYKTRFTTVFTKASYWNLSRSVSSESALSHSASSIHVLTCTPTPMPPKQ
jgi:hypothetical protein